MKDSLTLVQARHDSRLRQELSSDDGVKRAINKLNELRSGYGFSFRHELLAGALRLSRGMAPELADAVAECKEITGVTEPIELFISRDVDLNAFVTRSVAGPLIICLTSRLVESFSPAELRFVIGHELGHAAYNHLGLPMPAIGRIEDLAGRIVSRPTLLKLFLWSRSAEISADRAGLLCCKDPNAAAQAFFKVATGVFSSRIRFDPTAYAAQGESLASTPKAFKDGREEDYHLEGFSTHPYGPFRVRALLSFGRSEPFIKTMGGTGAGELSADQLEQQIERDLSRMEPTYLEEKSARSELMRRLLFHAGMAVAWADHTVDDKEREALRMLLGHDTAKEPGNIDEARALFDKDADQANSEIPFEFRVQLVQHLAVIAGADGHVHANELTEMHRAAAMLKVDPFVADQTLRASASPLD